MIKGLLVVYVIYLLFVGYWCVEFKQDGAKVKYCNPKYITECSVFTGRRSRREPYTTNMTGTTLMPFGNNVTFSLTLQMKSGGDFRVTAKACDALKAEWMVDYMNRYSNVTIDKCPFPAAKYKYTNMELPPKNMPVPMLNGDYYIKMELYITATKEPIADVVTLLHFDQNNRNNRNKNKKG